MKSIPHGTSAALVLALGLGPPAARADNSCRNVEVLFTPQGFPAENGREPLNPQIAAWIEDPSGKWVADVYVTRSVGLLGLGNRPGQPRLKSSYRWPYGSRQMALPIWAFHRQKTYGMVVMGGSCSKIYDPNIPPTKTTCPDDFNGDISDDNTTIAYHGPVSSTEPFYCSPSGFTSQIQNGVDVISCASAFFGSKGWYAPGYVSHYPPRADLTAFASADSADATRFAADNDVAAISSATPPPGQLLTPPATFQTPAGMADGDYVMQVEVNMEGDFNAFWQPGKCVAEPHMEWNGLGKDFIGQPSILYSVPFVLDSSGRTATTVDYSGYGDWTGDSGTVNPPDMTISTSAGSGGDRLKLTTDDNGSWRVKVSVSPCSVGPCLAAAGMAGLDTSQTSDSSITVQFTVPDGEAAAVYQVHYQAGTPITDANFDDAAPAPPPPLGVPGQVVSTQITGLLGQTQYYIAARAVSACGKASPLVTAQATTQKKVFTTLSGCFIATAAYGSPLEGEVAALRRLRDRHLLTNPAGQLAVAAYYAMSPPLAGAIRGNDALRALARQALGPIVGLLH